MTSCVFWIQVDRRKGFMRISDMARVMNIPRGTVATLRSRGLAPRGDQAVALARELKCTVEELFQEPDTHLQAVSR